MKTCKICKRPIKDGEEDMGPVCEHKFGEETNIIMNYQNKIEEFEKKIEISEMAISSELKLDTIMNEVSPANNGIYMSIFKKSQKKENSCDSFYATTRPLLNDLENQGMIRQSSVYKVESIRALHNHQPVRDFLMKLIRDAKK